MDLILWLLKSRENRARTKRLLEYEDQNRLAEMVPWWDLEDDEIVQSTEYWSKW